MTRLRSAQALLLLTAAAALGPLPAPAIHTFNGTDDCSRIEVTAVYFLPQGRTPLPDWRERRRRLEAGGLLLR